jgi:hypothetical protein
MVECFDKITEVKLYFVECFLIVLDEHISVVIKANTKKLFL